MSTCQQARQARMIASFARKWRHCSPTMSTKSLKSTRNTSLSAGLRSFRLLAETPTLVSQWVNDWEFQILEIAIPSTKLGGLFKKKTPIQEDLNWNYESPPANGDKFSIPPHCVHRVGLIAPGSSKLVPVVFLLSHFCPIFVPCRCFKAKL